ncbi:D-mannonate dehydratase ManD [Rugosimonospora africana]|uniref:D-mannonate dehydratase ManD n=1 Tax=Rugosimonospora africana TaxID=556532 RepID=UPI00194485CC|nr:D-mannonate dehydratase ManD [Rugosimonospora africana]
MKIASADVVISSPGRNFVTLVLKTDDGLVGLGDATVNGRELAVASYLRDHVAPILIGRDAHAIEDTWQYLYRGAYWRRGPITMAAIAAVDVALWDLKAQAAGLPLYQILGGRSRNAIRAYGHAYGTDLDELTDSVRALLEQGFGAVRVQVSTPGIGGGYGVAEAGDGGYEPARGQRPVEEPFDPGRYVRSVPAMFDKLRNTFGPELDLLHDVHHRLTPIQAARLGKSLEGYAPYWLEDVSPAENQAALRLVRQHTTVPLATGETFNSVFDYLQLFADQSIDYVRSSVTHAGGITGLRRILDMAAVGQVKSAIHGPTDVSPVGLAAALHLDLALHNFGIQEFMQHVDLTFEVFDVGYSFANGYFQPGERPGLGVSLDARAAERFPYRAAYLPVGRLLDGTVHDW